MKLPLGKNSCVMESCLCQAHHPYALLLALMHLVRFHLGWYLQPPPTRTLTRTPRSPQHNQLQGCPQQGFLRWPEPPGARAGWQPGHS